MSKTAKLIITIVVAAAVLGAAGYFIIHPMWRNSQLAGTYVHEADDQLGEIVIVHEGKNVSVTVDGVEHEAEWDGINCITVDGKYEIWELFSDDKGTAGEALDDDEWKFDKEHIQSDIVVIWHAKEWIDGNYEVGDEGELSVTLFKK